MAEAQADSVRRLKRIQRFFQNFLPASKVHVGHIEGFQLIVKLLRLRERGDGAVQMQPDACAPLLKGTFIAEKRTLRNTRRKSKVCSEGRISLEVISVPERGNGQSSRRSGTVGQRCSSTS